MTEFFMTLWPLLNLLFLALIVAAVVMVVILLARKIRSGKKA